MLRRLRSASAAGGLINQGMAPGAATAFLVAGGVTSVPAAMAIWGPAEPQIVARDITVSLKGAFLPGLRFNAEA